MAALRAVYTVYGAGLAAFAVAALAVLLFSRSGSAGRRLRAVGELLVLGVLWPLAVLTSAGRQRAVAILRHHL